jgi:hypothetical protein
MTQEKLFYEAMSQLNKDFGYSEDEKDLFLNRYLAHMAARHVIEIREKLEDEKLPLPWGKVQFYKSYLPAKSPDEILGLDNAIYWSWYAEELREYIDLLDSLPKMEFVEKKKKVKQ